MDWWIMWAINNIEGNCYKISDNVVNFCIWIIMLFQWLLLMYTFASSLQFGVTTSEKIK